ncbi:MAG: hypothetical protein J2P30_00370 [Actinobacteria bacterium]|nr:hypothetical protein [Actinomycetota bacterium]
MNADLALICCACLLPIEGDTGFLAAAYPDIAKAKREHAEWEASHGDGAISLEDFILPPEDIHWRAYHDRCNPDPDGSAYQIGSAELSTWRGLTRWTAHLMAKNWFALSDWDDLLREAAGESPATRIMVLGQVAA